MRLRGDFVGRHPFLTSVLAVYSLFYATDPLVGSYCGTFRATAFRPLRNPLAMQR